MERERIFLRHNSMNISLNDDDVAKIKINHLKKKQPKKASIDRYTGIHVEEIK